MFAVWIVKFLFQFLFPANILCNRIHVCLHWTQNFTHPASINTVTRNRFSKMFSLTITRNCTVLNIPTSVFWFSKVRCSTALLLISVLRIHLVIIALWRSLILQIILKVVLEVVHGNGSFLNLNVYCNLDTMCTGNYVFRVT